MTGDCMTGDCMTGDCMMGDCMAGTCCWGLQRGGGVWLRGGLGAVWRGCIIWKTTR
jgi:hypothetical protein